MQYRFQSGERLYEISVDREGEVYRATIDGQPCEFSLLDDQPGQVSLMIDGRPATVYWASEGAQKWFSVDGCTYRLEKPAPRAARPTPGHGEGEAVRAPMPASVRAVQVAEGQAVEKGQTLLLLEAMKMEIRVRAPGSGRVARLLVSAGQTVEKDQMLVEIAAESPVGSGNE